MDRERRRRGGGLQPVRDMEIIEDRRHQREKDARRESLTGMGLVVAGVLFMGLAALSLFRVSQTGPAAHVLAGGSMGVALCLLYLGSKTLIEMDSDSGASIEF